MIPLVAALVVAFAATTVYAADLDAGRALFNRCRVCHTIAAGGASTVGPNLHGVFGRRAGTLPGFPYSPALRNAGIVWDERTLAAFIHDPKDDLPGNRMGFPGIANSADIADLLAYLKQVAR